MSSNESNGEKSGIGFFGLLALIFITLKLVGLIDWPWLVVLAPIWGPLSFWLVVLVIVSILLAIKER